jgi:hypothetical protein
MVVVIVKELEVFGGGGIDCVRFGDRSVDDNEDILIHLPHDHRQQD